MVKRIRAAAKKMLPPSFLRRLKLHLAGLNPRAYTEHIKADGAVRRFFIFGTPIHDNLGDHLIAAAEQQYLRSLAPDIPVYDIPTELFAAYPNEVSPCVRPQDIVFISGGGWMGNLWPDDELFMQAVLRRFARRKIIIFPQTVYYDEAMSAYMPILRAARETYRRCDDLTLCVRDRRSYEFATNALGFQERHCLLMPDIALLYRREGPIVDRQNTVLLCLRQDREKIRGDLQALSQTAKACGCSARGTDTVIQTIVPLHRRQRMIEKKLTEFSRARLVVTDRLHGMIFAFLARTPCVALDNKTSKVRGVCDLWLRETGRVLFVEKSTDVPAAVKKALAEADGSGTDTDFLPLFNALTSLIREEVAADAG
ncbi:polysaccharide pyruvyl transferase family protein [Oscillospiraceae bacterium WX1]